MAEPAARRKAARRGRSDREPDLPAFLPRRVSDRVPRARGAQALDPRRGCGVRNLVLEDVRKHPSRHALYDEAAALRAPDNGGVPSAPLALSLCVAAVEIPPALSRSGKQNAARQPDRADTIVVARRVGRLRRPPPSVGAQARGRAALTDEREAVTAKGTRATVCGRRFAV